MSKLNSLLYRLELYLIKCVEGFLSEEGFDATGDRLDEHLWAMVFRSSLSLEER